MQLEAKAEAEARVREVSSRSSMSPSLAIHE